MTTRAALEWATKPVGHPQEWAARLSVARGFARYLRRWTASARSHPRICCPAAGAADPVSVLRRRDRRR